MMGEAYEKLPGFEPGTITAAGEHATDCAIMVGNFRKHFQV